MKAIVVRDLFKHFAEVRAVDGVSFQVEEGEVFGLLGLNGAGKTTIINILCTLLMPTSGFAEVGGVLLNGDRDALRRRIGVVFQDPALDIKLTGRENLKFHAAMYGLPPSVRRARIAEMLDLVELSDKADLLVENYSGGMKRRLEIARGFIHHPTVLFLDEPTLGLDAQTRRRIWEYIRTLNRESGVSIILTTHYLEEADCLCSRIAIIDRGRIIALGSPAELKDGVGGDKLLLQTSTGADEFIQLVGGYSWIRSATHYDNCIDLTLDRGETRIPKLLRLAREAGCEVVSVSLRKPSLEDAFLQHTGRSIRDEESGSDEFHRWRWSYHGRRR